MARRLERSIDIDAPVDKVWAAFSEFDRWSEWNPFVVEIAGDFNVGGRLRTRMRPPGGKPIGFKPTVLAFEPGRELRWVGHVLFPGVFDGEHSFRFEPIDGDRTRLVQSETFRGVLTPLLMGTKGQDRTAQGFEAMNQALKRLVEDGG